MVACRQLHHWNFSPCWYVENFQENDVWSVDTTTTSHCHTAGRCQPLVHPSTCETPRAIADFGEEAYRSTCEKKNDRGLKTQTTTNCAIHLHNTCTKKATFGCCCDRLLSKLSKLPACALNVAWHVCFRSLTSYATSRTPSKQINEVRTSEPTFIQ